MCKVFGLPELRTKAHFCAVTSTSGTGTEVTAFSIITDYDMGIKFPIADFQITPDVAIVDPDLVASLPPKLVAHTGMDARAAMHDAQCMAGIAFSSGLLGIVHSLAHKTGAAFTDYGDGAHIIHGAANAMYLPKVVAFNANDAVALSRYAQFADEFGLEGANEKATGRSGAQAPPDGPRRTTISHSE